MSQWEDYYEMRFVKEFKKQRDIVEETRRDLYRELNKGVHSKAKRSSSGVSVEGRLDIMLFEVLWAWVFIDRLLQKGQKYQEKLMRNM